MARRDPAPSDGYLQGWTEVVGAYAAGRPGDALDRLDRLEAVVEGRSAALAHARACLLCAGGHPDRALELARGVVAAGSRWTARKLADPDLAALRRLPEWPSLEETMREREAAALHQAARREPKVRILGDDGLPARAAVVGGERDFALDDQRALDRALGEAGVGCTLAVVPGLAHCYPPDWTEMGARLVADLVR